MVGGKPARRMIMRGLGSSLRPGEVSPSAPCGAPIAARSISRRELLFWLACVLLANQVLWEPGQSALQVIEALPQLIASKSIFFYLGWYVVFRLLTESAPERSASGLDLTVGFAVCLINFLPGRSAAGIAVTVLAAYLLATTAANEKLRAAAAVLLGLSLNSAWGPKFLELFAYHLVRVDAALVGSALMITWPEVIWNGNIVGTRNGHSIIVYASCSSLQNISLGLLCWVSIKSLVRTHWLRADIWIGLLVCAVVVLLNVSRLYLTALSPEQYAYWHGGFGEEIYLWAATLIVLLISLWGALRVRQMS